MKRRQKETTSPDSEIVPALKAGLDTGDDSTSLPRLQLTEDDRTADARCRAWSKALLARIVEAADASAESYRSKL